MPTAEKGTGRYTPGAYKRPEPKEVEVEGLGTFLVQALSTREQEQIEGEVTREKGESEDDFGERLGYAKMSAALLEPKMTPEQIQEDSQEWTPRQNAEFSMRVALAAQSIDEEDFADVRSRFRSEDDQ